MQLHAKALLAGIAAEGFPQFEVAGVFAVDAAIDTDAAIVVAVPGIHRFDKGLALLVSIKIKILVLVDEAVRR